MFKLTTIEL